jgi:NTE family protein
MPTPSCERCYSIVFAGGVSLGAYQAGAFASLESRGWRLVAVGGSSVGAINAALIAGNAPERRLRALQEFWRYDAALLRSGDPELQRGLQSTDLRHLECWASALRARVFGVPDQFVPRLPDLSTRFRSLYDVEPLRRRVETLVDFDRINKGEINLLVATTDVETGAGITFSTAAGDLISVDHLLASCGFLPEFPLLCIGGRLLGDGGLHANAPVRALISSASDAELCVVVDTMSAEGNRPASLEEAMARKSDLLLANQTVQELASVEREEALRKEFRDLLTRLPAGCIEAEEVRRLQKLTRSMPRIVKLCYRAPEWEAGPERMYDYSARTIAHRWLAGERAVAAMSDATGE